MVNINKYIKALLHPAGGHQGIHKAHQVGNRSKMAAILYQRKCVKQDCNDYTLFFSISYTYSIPHHLGYVRNTAFLS